VRVALADPGLHVVDGVAHDLVDRVEVADVRAPVDVLEPHLGQRVGQVADDVGGHPEDEVLERRGALWTDRLARVTIQSGSSSAAPGSRSLRLFVMKA